MFNIRATLIVCTICVPLAIQGQTATDGAPALPPPDNDAAWEELMQELADEAGTADESEAMEGIIDELNDMREHPIDINTATKTELMRLPFLDQTQVDGILDHVAHYGPLHDLGELLLVRGVGQREVGWLRLCATVGSGNAAATATRGAYTNRMSHELTTRLDIPLYERAGWPWARGLAHRWRYVARWRRWEAGARGEKDAGEPMFTRQVPLWDAMGAYASVSDVGCLRTAIVGDYRVSAGEGLVINQGFGLGKMLTQTWSGAATVRPHRSTEEIHFMRGAAATVDVGRGVELTAFASARRMDAVVNADNTINGLATSALHRTPTELNHRRNIWSHTAGARAAWSGKHFGVGATALWQHYDHALTTGGALYRQIYPTGTHFGNVGIDYRVRWKHIVVRGETARSFAANGGGWATLNRAAWRPNPNMQLSVVQRFYSYRYHGAHARAFGEVQRVQNESGVCVRADAERLGPFALTAYFDVFHSPWPRYTMTHASTGYEAFVQGSFAPNRRHTLTASYRMKNKERSDERGTDHNVRATYVWHMAREWSAGAMGVMHRRRTASTAANGFGLAARANYASRSERLTASVMALVFATDGYDSRIALYEPTLTQTFGLTQLYGRGQRVAATLRIRIGRAIGLQAKVGATHYDDRSTIGSGATLIASPWKADVQLLLRLALR